jgi:tetratricopeptide (TPR) repeat protein
VFGAFAYLTRPEGAFIIAATGLVLLATGTASVYIQHGRADDPVTAPVNIASSATGVRPAAAPAAIDPPARALDAGLAGNAAYGRGDIAGALAQFEAAVEANPQDPVALNNVGQVLVRDNRPQDALAYFDRAVARAPEHWAYHFNRARAYALLGQWPQAIAGYQEAARLFPDDYVTEYNLARALQAAGRLDEAIAGFERAIALAPGQADFHLSHGLALEAVGRTTEAAAAYRHYLELEPTATNAAQVKARAEQMEQGAAVAATTGAVQ